MEKYIYPYEDLAEYMEQVRDCLMEVYPLKDDELGKISAIINKLRELDTPTRYSLGNMEFNQVMEYIAYRWSAYTPSNKEAIIGIMTNKTFTSVIDALVSGWDEMSRDDKNFLTSLFFNQ